MPRWLFGVVVGAVVFTLSEYLHANSVVDIAHEPWFRAAGTIGALVAGVITAFAPIPSRGDEPQEKKQKHW